MILPPLERMTGLIGASMEATPPLTTRLRGVVRSAMLQPLALVRSASPIQAIRCSRLVGPAAHRLPAQRTTMVYMLFRPTGMAFPSPRLRIPLYEHFTYWWVG